MKFKIFKLDQSKNVYEMGYDTSENPPEVKVYPYFLWEPTLGIDNLFNSYEEAISYLDANEDLAYNYECVILPYWKSTETKYD